MAAIIGAPMTEFSLLGFLCAVKSGGGYEYMDAFKGGAQEWKLKGGSQGLCEKILDFLAKEKECEISFGKTVSKISQNESGVEICTSDGSSYSCDFCVCTVPLNLLETITWSPPLSEQMVQLVQGEPFFPLLYFSNEFYFKKNEKDLQWETCSRFC